MGGLSIGPDGQQQQVPPTRSYIPPHMRNRQGAAPPMNGPAPVAVGGPAGPLPGAAAGPLPGAAAGPPPGGPAPANGLDNSNWAG